MSRLVEALHRLNAAYPWDHNAHCHRWLLRQLPRAAGRVLDVGCGSGELVRRLAGRRAEAVVGVDADAGILGRARESTSVDAPVPTYSPRRPAAFPRVPTTSSPASPYSTTFPSPGLSSGSGRSWRAAAPWSSSAVRGRKGGSTTRSGWRP
ncbi:class I SAM-dependent methyltransferase [Streptomyces monashensis]|uniref:class I SAM-dependent methyltransferase n=1 Tax=Streptomyces monashensis TaxID=1678012 RepID=UPI003CCBCD05